MFMTEGTVEEVGGTGFDILLGLRWWDGMVKTPFWSAIYGGYGYATGAAGLVTLPLARGLCTQVRGHDCARARGGRHARHAA